MTAEEDSANDHHHLRMISKKRQLTGPTGRVAREESPVVKLNRLSFVSNSGSVL